MFYLILLNFALFVVCYLTGYIPIYFKIPFSKLRLFTLFGAGILLGTAFIVISEGAESVYQFAKTSHSSGHSKDGNVNANDIQQEGHTPSVCQKIVFSLLLGYLFMLIIDQTSHSMLQSGCAQRFVKLMQHCSCCWKYRTIGGRSVLMTSTVADMPESPSDVEQQNKGFTVTCGLVVHSFADGLAIGSAFAFGQLRLELILFFAILLHKAPAAFGLTCFLLHQGLSRDQIRYHLFAFSLAAPLGAFMTYLYFILPLLFNSAASEYDAASNSSVRTGFALLFSGGTFLYVAATQILPELIRAVDSNVPCLTDVSFSSSSEVVADASEESVVGFGNRLVPKLRHAPHLTLCEMFVVCVGMLIPVVLIADHTH